MGYKIQYRAGQNKNVVTIRLPMLILFFFFLFCVQVYAKRPDAAIYLERFGLFSDNTMMVSALNDLADELQSGDGIISFLRNFVRKIIP